MTVQKSDRYMYVSVIRTNAAVKRPINMSANQFETVATHPLEELTAFQRDMLHIIAGFRKPSGQTIKDELEKYYTEEINHGRLYPNLDTLVNKGLVEKGAHDKRTNYYDLTSDGAAKLRGHGKWRSEVCGE